MNSHAFPAALWTLIPAYNAEASIASVVRQALTITAPATDAPAAAPRPVPVLVVDDGSTDHTAAAAEAAGAVVLRHAGNRGKGAALQTGFAYALAHGAQAVLTLDADGQHDPAEAGALIAAHLADKESLVIGVRSFDPALMPRRSRIGNQISTFFISRFAGRPHRDTQSGYRIYPRRLLTAPLRTRRFDTETELVLWAAKLGVPLREVPIRTIYAGRGAPPDAAPSMPNLHDGAEQPVHKSHFRNLEDTLRVLRLVIGSPWWRTDAADAPSR
jgi:glycosyltransferase involved in cell wall biosynthesis